MQIIKCICILILVASGFYALNILVDIVICKLRHKKYIDVDIVDALGEKGDEEWK